MWHYPHYIDARQVTPQTAIRLGSYKLIYEYESGKSYLFDLSADLEERYNLAQRDVETAESLKAKLQRYLTDTGAALPD